MACHRAPGDGWRRWLRLRPVVLGLAAVALAAAVIDLPAEHRDYVAARLLLDAVPHPPFHLPAPAANRPLVRTIDLGHGHAAIATTASLDLPARGNRLPGIVIVVGAAPLGRHDPQVVQLARALVRAGRAVLVPDLALRASALSSANLQQIAATFDALAALPRVDPGRIGLLGVSWGGALAVVAASTAPLAAKVAFVATFGAFYDLADLAGAVVTGASVYHGQIVRWHTVPEAQALVRSALLSRLTPGQASAVQAALADPRALPTLPPSIQRVRQAFSPAFYVQGLRAPLLALHSTDDPAAPWTESALLVVAARAHDRGGAWLTLVHVFSHVTQNGSLVAPSALLDDWRLVRYVAGLLQRWRHRRAAWPAHGQRVRPRAARRP